MTLGVEYGCKYTLTGPDGTIAVFNDSADPNFVGILSPESSGLDSPDVREDAQDSVEDDGGIHGDFFYGRRPVVLQGTIIASSVTNRNEKVDKIKRASNALRGDATLKWKPTGATEEVELKLRRQQPLRVTKGYVKDFQIPMVSASAVIVGASEKSVEGSALLSSTKSPGAGSNTTGVGSVAWTLPGNITASDNVYASASFAGSDESNYLRSSSYGFTFPTGARIIGFEPSIERKKTGAASSTEKLFAVKAGTVQTGEIFFESTEFKDTTDTVKTTGGKSTLLGGGWTKADVENAGFGVAYVSKAFIATTVTVDHVPIKVYYAVPFEVENAGDTSADFEAVFSGEHSSPVELINEVTGEKIVIEQSISAGQTIVINSATNTVVHSTLGNIYDKLNFSASTWFKLTPGKTKLICPSGKVTIKYKNSWL